MMSSTLRLYPDVVVMSQHCILLLFFVSKAFLMSRHFSSGVATLSSDVLRGVTAYVMSMSRHCSFALLISTNGVTMSQLWSN